MRTIHFVQTNEIIGTNVVLPLAVGVLWAYASAFPEIKNNWQVGKIIYKPENLEGTALELSQGDLVCMSMYVWNSDWQFRLARRIKEINPNVYIIIGGPNLTHARNIWPDYAGIVDLAQVGEGEHAFVKILKTWPDLCLEDIPGAWTIDYQGSEAPRIEDLSSPVSPFLIGFYDSIVAEAKHQGYQIQAVIQTNRGCPYHCTFCESGRDYKNKLFQYDEQRIKNEIEWCAKNQVDYLSIGDDNWGIFQRDVEFMRWIRDCKLRYGYPTVIDATYAKNAVDRVLEMARIDAEYDTGLMRAINISLQTSTPDVLKAIRRWNLVPEKTIKLIKEFNDLGTPVSTELIWPLPHETYESYLSSIENVIDLGIKNWIEIYPLGLYAGTQLHDDYSDSYVMGENQDRYIAKVKSSKWVDEETLIRGNIFFAWLATMYLLGFIRPTLELLKQHHGVPITRTVDNFMAWAEQRPGDISQWYKKMHIWWHAWINGDRQPDIGIFPGEDTFYWKPNVHLPSWIQSDLDYFYSEFNQFMAEAHPHVKMGEDRQGIIEFDRTYPIIGDHFTVSTRRPVPKFSSLFEFCRYYYLYRRKSGDNRTVIDFSY